MQRLRGYAARSPDRAAQLVAARQIFNRVRGVSDDLGPLPLRQPQAGARKDQVRVTGADPARVPVPDRDELLLNGSIGG
jgi:hypothetical protein